MTLRTVCDELGLSHLRVLIIEDDETDYLQTSALLQQGRIGELKITWMQNFDDGRAALVNGDFDICLLDYRLDGRRTGLDLVWDMGDQVICPIIMLTGAGGRDVDVRAMKAGVADYFEKEIVSAEVLSRSIRFAVYRSRVGSSVHSTTEDETDMLTGFDNPSLFQAKFESALHRAKRERRRLALLTVDLDGFKKINTRYGYNTGDEILIEVADRLRKTIRECDHVGKTTSASGRIGGDVFSIVLEGIDLPENIEMVGSKIIAALGTGDYEIDGNMKDLDMNVSIGCAFFPDDAHKTESLMDFAELAMLRAKAEKGSLLLTYNHFGTVPRSHEDISAEFYI